MQKSESVGMIIWREIYPVLIFFGAEILVETVFIMIYVISMIGSGGIGVGTDVTALQNDMMNYVYKYILYMTAIRCLIIIPIYFLLMHKDVKKDKEYGRHVEYETFKKPWLLLLPVVGFTAAMGFNHLIDFTGLIKLSDSYNELAEMIYTGNLFVEIISSSIAAPIAEELLFRGLIYKRLRNHMNIVPCMIISSAAFGLIHGNLVQFVYAFLVGVVLAYVYEKFKTIWAPIICHAGANLLAVLVTELMPAFTINSIGLYMLIIVIELAVTFLLLKLIDVKVNRKEVEITNPNVGENY